MSLSKIKFTYIWQKYKPLKIILCMRDLQLSCNSSIPTEHTISSPHNSVVQHVRDLSSEDMSASMRWPFGRHGGHHRLDAKQIHLTFLSFIHLNLRCYAFVMAVEGIPPFCSFEIPQVPSIRRNGKKVLHSPWQGEGCGGRWNSGIKTQMIIKTRPYWDKNFDMGNYNKEYSSKQKYEVDRITE